MAGRTQPGQECDLTAPWSGTGKGLALGPRLQTLEGEKRARPEGRAGHGLSVSRSAQTTPAFASHSSRRRKGASEPSRAVKGPRSQPCFKLALPALRTASVQLMAPEMPQPLPPMSRAHNPKKHLLASLAFH